MRDEDGDELRQISNNAFLHYYSGMLYDWDGEINDAFIAYRNAAVAYQQNHDLLQEEIPPSLGRDLDRVGARLGFRQELIDLHKSCGDVFAGEDAAVDLPATRQDYEEAAQSGWQRGQGEVVLLIETGFVPKKTQVRFDFPIFENETYDDPDYWSWEIQAGLGNLQAFTKGRKIEYWVTVAAPELQDAPGPVGGVRVSVPTLDGHAVGSRASNLRREARITFDAEKPTIFFKTIARGLTKYLATRQAKKSGGSWAGFAANLFGAATETADTRSWLTLPQEVQLVRLSLPAGQYDLQVQLLDRQGRALGSETIPAVEVTAGDWTFLSRRVF